MGVELFATMGASATAVDPSSPVISAFAALLPPAPKNNSQCCDQHWKSQVLTTRGMKGGFAERWRAPPYATRLGRHPLAPRSRSSVGNCRSVTVATFLLSCARG